MKIILSQAAYKSFRKMFQTRMKFFYTAFIIFYNFTMSRSEQFKVIGPSLPIVAVAGEDLILPCSLQPNISAVDMTVEWFRVDKTDSAVHLYTQHEEQNKEQSVSYRGRTALFKEELQRGNTSLKLSEVQVSDDGIYKCVLRSQTFYDDATLTVIVEATGTDPVITVEEHVVAGGISLVCESKGWNPEPEVEWLDSEGATLTAESTETQKDSKGFDVKRHVTVYSSDSRRFYCRIKYGRHMKQTKVKISGKSFIKWQISVIFNFLFLSVILTGTGLGSCVYCWRKGTQRRIRKEIEKNRMYTVDVTLDAETAHPYLNLSEDGRNVEYGKKQEDYCDGLHNFDDCISVLGKTGFKKSFYFEVQVRGKTHWTVGVAKESIKKKGEITMRPDFGFWILRRKNNWFSPRTTVSPRRKIKKVGVFVDYEEGVVSFYDVDAMSHIYSFVDQSFSEKLYPIFSPGLKHEGKNAAPLIITDVPKSYLQKKEVSSTTTDIEEHLTTNANEDRL